MLKFIAILDYHKKMKLVFVFWKKKSFLLEVMENYEASVL